MNKDDRKNADDILIPLLKVWPQAYLEDGKAIARISAVGAGMPSTPGTAARIFRALANKDINIGMIATSEIRTSCVIPEVDGVKALNAVHSEFNLGTTEN